MSASDIDKGTVLWALYKALTVVADILEDMFWRPVPRTEQPPHESVYWSPEEFREKRRRAVPLQESKNRIGGHTIFVLDEHTVTKPKPLDLNSYEIELEREMLAWRYVWENTTIPVPRHHRSFYERGSTVVHIVMDFIEGERLDRAWPKLSIWSRFRVAWALRSYVRQLRRAPVPSSAFPGPLGPRPRECKGLSVSLIRPTGEAGPFESAQDLADLAQKIAERRSNGTYKRQPELEKPEPLVFTHNDINMRNVMLGKDGTVYLIDWDYSGFYPRSFEYVSMMESLDPCFRHPWPEWAWYCPFIADPYFAYYRWLYGYLP